VRHEPAGDADYESTGGHYSVIRRPEPEFAAAIRVALEDAQSVINIGAGAGSYEPTDMLVTAIEPSASMRLQRPESLVPAIDAVAEDLPFPDQAFDSALASVTIHQWRDLAKGLSEMRRVTRGPIVIMTFDPDSLQRFWLTDYSSELMSFEAGRMPRLDTIIDLLGGSSTVIDLPIPKECRDGFAEAYFGRPEEFLNADVRRSQSSWGFISKSQEESVVEQLRVDIDGGRWDQRFGRLRELSHYQGSLRLIVNHRS
jgi:SAM-dependent methyltransferase